MARCLPERRIAYLLANAACYRKSRRGCRSFLGLKSSLADGRSGGRTPWLCVSQWTRRQAKLATPHPTPAAARRSDPATRRAVRNASGMGQSDFSSIHAQAIHKPRVGQAGRGIWMEIGRREGKPQLQAPGAGLWLPSYIRKRMYRWGERWIP